MSSRRCMHCSHEYSAPLETPAGPRCPACGSANRPLDIALDMSVRINWHELRALCLWADAYAQLHLDAAEQATVRGIVRRLMAQRPEGGAPIPHS